MMNDLELLKNIKKQSVSPFLFDKIQHKINTLEVDNLKEKRWNSWILAVSSILILINIQFLANYFLAEQNSDYNYIEININTSLY